MKHNKIKATLYSFLLASLFLISPLAIHADDLLGSAPAIVIPHQQDLDFRSRVLNIDVLANIDYEVSANESWVTVNKTNKGVTIRLKQNTTPYSRAAIITFTNTDENVTKTLGLSQTQDGTAELIETGEIAVSSASVNTYQPGANIDQSYDNNTATIYHSKWSEAVNPSNPAILTYNFKDVDRIDYVYYIPRSGGGNGAFGEIEVWTKCQGESDYTKYGDYDFGLSGNPSSVIFKDGLINPVSIQFKVLTGNNEFASCAEMQFRHDIEIAGIENIFVDNVMSALKPGITQTDIDNITHPFIRTLAQKEFDKTYEADKRVREYECILSPEVLSKQWSTPGKLYDQIQGVTGIMLKPGKTIVAVDGLTSETSASLRVIGWTVPEGETFKSEAYPLRNGLNLIDRTNDWNALAYIAYYNDVPDNKPNIKVHIIEGTYNGILSPDLSNDEMQQLVENAPYTTIDLFGSKVHSVWETSALNQYTTGKYRQYMNVLDTLVAWEHRLIGLEKYNRLPKNKTFAYVNYNYYMYQGGMGVTFKYDTQNRCCSPDNIMNHDSDVVWGLSHEWGHQQQMQPYFCWSGLSECSNNMNSAYNVLHMGYPATRVSNRWASGRQIFLNNTGYGKVSEARKKAYDNRNYFNWSPKILAMATAMEDSTIYSQTVNIDKAIHINEVNVEETLAPFFMLHCYFSQHGLSDYSPDLYESLRTTDTDNDKYAMIASAQNSIEGRYDAFKAAYPNSCWITDNYIYDGSSRWQNSVPFIFNYVRKASKICGYNLYPFFEKWGFFRLVALRLQDYGDKHYCMTQEMKDEFETDMEALGLKELDATLLNTICTVPLPQYDTPVIPN